MWTVEQGRRLIDVLVPVMWQAGQLAMDVYRSDFAVHEKADASPVTAADEAIEALLVPVLKGLLPAVPVVAEEAVSGGDIPAVGERFWLVDPLDGTREFVHRNGEFTVNVALIEGGVPVLGLVQLPVLGRLYGGLAGDGAWLETEPGSPRRSIACRHVPAEGVTVVSSRSHGDAAALERFLAGRQVAARRTAGSSLKLCTIATGEADLYPRLGRTMEWDIAAGHGVLAAAGGKIETLDGDPLRYGKPGFENPFFVASGAG